MKKYLFLLAAFVFIAFSCSKDEFPQDSNTDSQLEMRSNNGIPGVTNNGKWLVFRSQADYNRIKELLQSRIEDYDFETSGIIMTDETFDFDPVLAEFEQILRHTSLRHVNLKTEFDKYNHGGTPEEVMSQIQDYGLLDDVELAFLSVDGVVQIGRKIKMLRNGGVTITTPKMEIAEQILANGSKEALTPENIKHVVIEHTTGTVGPGGSLAPECSSEFSQFGEINETENGDFQATFQWDQILQAGILTNLSFTWKWGDGSPETTNNSGSASHTYTEEGTYNVCLEVSWLYEGADETQNVECDATAVCKQIVVKEIEGVGFCDEDDLCTGALIISTLAPNVLSQQILDTDNSSPGKMCVNVNNIVALLADYCADVQPSDITLSFNGVEGECWETCDGNRDIVLKIGDACQITLPVLFSEEPNCDAGDFDTGWHWISIDDKTGLSVRQQTKSQANGGFYNRLKSKMIRKELRGGKWKRRRAFIGMKNAGVCLATKTCACDRELNPNASGFSSYKRYHKTLTENFGSNFDGLNLDLTRSDCWTTDYYSGPNNNNIPLRGTLSGCE